MALAWICCSQAIHRTAFQELRGFRRELRGIRQSLRRLRGDSKLVYRKRQGCVFAATIIHAFGD